MSTTIHDIYGIYTKVIVQDHTGCTSSNQNHESILVQAKIRPNLQGNSSEIHFIIPDTYRESFVKLYFHLKSSLADYKQISWDEWVKIPLDELDTGSGRTVLYIKDIL